MHIFKQSLGNLELLKGELNIENVGQFKELFCQVQYSPATDHIQIQKGQTHYQIGNQEVTVLIDHVTCDPSQVEGDLSLFDHDHEMAHLIGQVDLKNHRFNLIAGSHFFGIQPQSLALDFTNTLVLEAQFTEHLSCKGKPIFSNTHFQLEDLSVQTLYGSGQGHLSYSFATSQAEGELSIKAPTPYGEMTSSLLHALNGQVRTDFTLSKPILKFLVSLQPFSRMISFIKHIWVEEK